MPELYTVEPEQLTRSIMAAQRDCEILCFGLRELDSASLSMVIADTAGTL